MAEPPRPPGVRPGLLRAFQAAFFAISLNLALIAPLLPELARAVGRPVGQLGVLVTAFALPYALVAPLLAPASERLGRRALVLAGLGAFVLGQLAAVAAPGLPALLAARAVVGLGAAAFTPAAYAALAERSPLAERARTLGAVLLAATVGSIVGLPLGGLAVAAAGWRGAFGLLAGLGLVALAALAATLPAGRPAPVARRYGDDLRAALGAPGAGLTLLVTVLWSAGYNGTLAYSGVLLAARYGLPAERIALLFGGLGVAGLLGNRLAARLGRRWGDRRMVLAAIAALAVAPPLLPLTTVTPGVTVALTGLLPAAVQFGWPALLSIAAGLAPRAPATALALNNSAYYPGGALGPPLVGLAVGAWGIGGMGLPGAALASLALALAARGLARLR